MYFILFWFSYLISFWAWIIFTVLYTHCTYAVPVPTSLVSLLYVTYYLFLDIFRTVGPVLEEAIERYWQRVAARKSRGA
jgi:hypothetical protein